MDIRGRVLWWAAKRRIARDNCRIIAIGGAIAKTSTKFAIGTMLELAYPKQVRVGYGNLNSYLGVPLSILGFELDFYQKPVRFWGWARLLLAAFGRSLFTKLPRYLVVEYATDQPGDIEAITAQLPPDIGVITIVGPAHVANYPSMEAVAKDEGYVAERTKKEGFVLVNSSDQYLTDHHRRSKARVVNVVTSLEEISIKFMEALGREMNISSELIKKASIELHRPERRFQYEELDGARLIDDSYNASPLAVKAAINLLAKLPKKRIAILGDMRELGDGSAAYHQEIGRYAKKYVDTLIAVGEEAKAYNADVWYPDAETAAVKVARTLEGGSILVKGSKSVHMEIVADKIREKFKHQEVGEGADVAL